MFTACKTCIFICNLIKLIFFQFLLEELLADVSVPCKDAEGKGNYQIPYGRQLKDILKRNCLNLNKMQMVVVFNGFFAERGSEFL